MTFASGTERAGEFAQNGRIGVGLILLAEEAYRLGVALAGGEGLFAGNLTGVQDFAQHEAVFVLGEVAKE